MSTVLWADYLAFMETGSAEEFDDLVEKSVAVAGEQYNAWPLWKNGPQESHEVSPSS